MRPSLIRVRRTPTLMTRTRKLANSPTWLRIISNLRKLSCRGAAYGLLHSVSTPVKTLEPNRRTLVKSTRARTPTTYWKLPRAAHTVTYIPRSMTCWAVNSQFYQHLVTNPTIVCRTPFRRATPLERSLSFTRSPLASLD